MKVKIVIENNVLANLPGTKSLRKVTRQVLKMEEQWDARVAITVFYVDSTQIEQLNREHRGKECPTDVLSFRLVENPDRLCLTAENFSADFDRKERTIYLGDIFICNEIAATSAAEFGHTVFREVLELYVHGLLHLLGYDHHTEKESMEMAKKENSMNEYLNKKKIA